MNNNLKTLTIFLLAVLISNASNTQQTLPKIDFIITNDYMSERNLSMMGGPIPSRYHKEIIDSLQNCFVEKYENENIVRKKFYNKVGALYHSTLYIYDNKKRLEKSLDIDEYRDDTCVIQYQYTDSSKLITHKKITNSCKKEWLDFYYKYNKNREKTEIVLNVNDTLDYKDSIQNISKSERRVQSHDGQNRLSTYLYKYNEKDLLVYEKRKSWDYVIKGEYFETSEEYEYLYKYDDNGNWTERIKQTYCPPKKKTVIKRRKVAHKGDVKIEPPKVKEDLPDDCQPEVKEKLVRKIFYK